MIYQRYINTRVGIELVMLVTVLTGFIYGGIIGGIVGFATLALASYLSGEFSHNLFPSFVMITLAGLLSPLFSNIFGNITVAGIVLTLIYDVVIVFVYITWFRKRIPKVALFAITHFFWNVWIFVKIAPLILNTMG